MKVRSPVAAALVSLMACATVAAPAQAAAGPSAGQCFNVSDAQSFEDYWPTGLAPVPCSGSHTIQITRAAPLPADVNAFDFAAQQCDYASVWREAGINQPVKGIVNRPVRIEAFSWTVREPGVPASFVCGAGPLRYRGTADPVLVPFTGALPGLSASERARLQFCTSARSGRSSAAAPITVPCTSRPRWQVTRWILWDTFYDAYPGQAVLTRRAAALCGPTTEFSVPTAKDWPGGTHRTWCYTRHA